LDFVAFLKLRLRFDSFIYISSLDVRVIGVMIDVLTDVDLAKWLDDIEAKEQLEGHTRELTVYAL